MSVNTDYTNYYSQISYPAVRRARNFLRCQVLNGLSLFGSGGLLKQPHIQFLYYHHIFNDEVQGLARLLEMLSRNYRFISYTEAVNKLERGDIDAPYICFSSDDGFRNNLNGAAVFREYGISCCYFICPSMVGVTHPATLRSFCSDRLHLPPVEFLSWDEISRLQQQGHEIGNHTNSHERLSSLTPARQEEEITLAHEGLTTRCGTISHFAFPYGLDTDFTEHAHRHVNGLGYKSCASAVRGAYTPVAGKTDLSRELIKRDQVIFHHRPEHTRYFISGNIQKAVQRQA